MGWLLLCHTGCGDYSKAYGVSMQGLCTTALDHFRQGMLKLESSPYAPPHAHFKDRFYQLAVDTAAMLEDNPTTSAGRGSNPTVSERIELESCVMTDTQELGCVTCVTECRNPCRLAMAILREAQHERLLGRRPPRILTGAGADRFAHRCGLGDAHAQSYLLTGRRLAACRKWKAVLQQAENLTKRAKTDATTTSTSTCDGDDQDSVRDTVGLVAVHTSGAIIAIVSSGGHILKDDGRVGLAGVPGAGVWVDPQNHEDGTITQSATITTGTGEDVLSTMLARGCTRDAVAKFRQRFPSTAFAALSLTLTGTKHRDAGEVQLTRATIDVSQQHAGLVFGYATHHAEPETFMKVSPHQQIAVSLDGQREQ
ncbi:hypothetical protein PTSG_12219 [Salpingoeca rosetta]|uniref:Uncharacterized protein n=1 Tax=Salpingoeca rosetta (strain ATCC 50818 / BSB-021) TaxID=946362 RepID=F2U9W9_SALR5|nr:uncharacterized protein PTSG_12219 [Salpingoeca rosetta]EGD73146.1 hypothetical protein PTSG_12219 [Salpingoeca rosetta]|eukprot:XP_004994177.1 hypothetical protein PTSG_12219 [Salpingoeca rosetta]